MQVIAIVPVHCVTLHCTALYSTIYPYTLPTYCGGAGPHEIHLELGPNEKGEHFPCVFLPHLTDHQKGDEPIRYIEALVVLGILHAVHSYQIVRVAAVGGIPNRRKRQEFIPVTRGASGTLVGNVI